MYCNLKSKYSTCKKTPTQQLRRDRRENLKRSRSGQSRAEFKSGVPPFRCGAVRSRAGAGRSSRARINQCTNRERQSPRESTCPACAGRRRRAQTRTARARARGHKTTLLMSDQVRSGQGMSRSRFKRSSLAHLFSIYTLVQYLFVSQSQYLFTLVLYLIG